MRALSWKHLECHSRAAATWQDRHIGSLRAGPRKSAPVPSQDIPPELLARLKAVTAKRPKTVIDHILEHGHITTEELTGIYGYDHPPRAARDVREQGIPLETFQVKSSTGRRIAAYRFGDLSSVLGGKLGGRKVAPKALKDLLLSKHGARCALCGTPYEGRYLQVDHRVPYEVAGEADSTDWDQKKFMLLCGSCNRSKSWSCEACENWQATKDPRICATCYWASPDTYVHVARRSMRRLAVVWTDDETRDYAKLELEAKTRGIPVEQLVKEKLAGRAQKR